MKDCCYQCTDRVPGCHGRNEDGTYKCAKWERQDRIKAELRKKAVEEMDYLEYKHESRVRHEKLRKNHRV